MTLALYGSRIHVNGDLVDDKAVLIRDGMIAAIVAVDAIPADARRVELHGGVLAAGFIDTQVNGGGGVLFNAAPTVESLRIIGAAHRKYGTTGFLPTIISDSASVIEQAIRAVEQAMEIGVPGVLGIHVEGPMLAPSRHGIHETRFFLGADHDLAGLVASMNCGRTLTTVAPEIVGPDVIAQLADAGVLVAAGHTEASYDQMREGFAAGITGVTHLFNAMSPFTSRAPGVVGATLENQTAWCGIIVDGVHVHPASLRVALLSRPLDRFMLVTDAMPPVGTDATSFDLQGREIFVTQDRCVDDKGTLAGSNLTMEGAVRNSVTMVGLSLEAALGMASASPAAFLGMSDVRGAIFAGGAADLVWIDDDMRVGETWIAGRSSAEAGA